MTHRHTILLLVALLIAPRATLLAVEPAKLRAKPNIIICGSITHQPTLIAAVVWGNFVAEVLMGCLTVSEPGTSSLRGLVAGH